MLDLDVTRVSLSFLLIAVTCYLAYAAFRPLRSLLLPRSVAETKDVAPVLGFNLVLCIGVLALILLIVPAAFGIPALVLVLLGVAAVRRGVSHNSSPHPGARPVREWVVGTLRSFRRRPVPVILTIASFGYFAWFLAYARWPSPGDIMSLHGPVTLYLATGGYGGVLAHLGYFYPFGFHLFPATLVSTLSLYPAEAVFVFGGFVVALIPPMMYHLADRLGAHPLLAALAFTAAFVAHPSDNMEKWIIGPFFNGPYPNLLGYLIILLLAVYLIDGFQEGITKAAVIRYAVPAILYSIILAFIYPSFAAWVLLDLGILAFVAAVAARRAAIRSAATSPPSRRLLVALGILLVVLVIAGVVWFTPLPSYVQQLYSSTPTGDMLAYRLDPSFFVDNLTGLVILLAMPIAVRDILLRRRLGISSFYLMISALLALSLDSVVYALVWPILPSRSVLILGTIAWPLLVVELSSMAKAFRVRWATRSVVGPTPALKNVRQLAPVVAVFVVVVAAQAFAFPAVSPLAAPAHYGWFGNTPYFQDDFGGAEWLVAHAAPSDLILSDGSYISRYALSMGFLALSNGPPLEYNHSLFDALNLVWAFPTNVTYIEQALKTYQVRYIFSTSEWGTLDREYTVVYLPKPHDPQTYAQIFDAYPFLQVVYQSGSTRVYQVNPSLL